jgi:hypothetical protein
VTDMDKLTKKGDRREDLRVAIPDRPGWTALVEVRGYKRGAQVNDLQRIGGRFRRRYLQETERDADKVWYVVNQYLGEEPDGRPPTFSYNQQDLETFAEDDGLVIDTVDLFRLLVALQRQEIEAGFARDRLIDASGRFDLATVLSKPAQSEGADGSVG